MIIYTDGSCRKNGDLANSSGGYAVVVLDDNQNLITTYAHQEHGTTNNRQELKAILYTMLVYGSKDPGDIPLVYSDSAYCVQTFNDWMWKWARNNWLKSNDRPPENLDLIKAYYDHYMKGYRIDLQKVAGHSGNKWNELADALACGRTTTHEGKI